MKKKISDTLLILVFIIFFIAFPFLWKLIGISGAINELGISITIGSNISNYAQYVSAVFSLVALCVAYLAYKKNTEIMEDERRVNKIRLFSDTQDNRLNQIYTLLNRGVRDDIETNKDRLNIIKDKFRKLSDELHGESFHHTAPVLNKIEIPKMNKYLDIGIDKMAYYELADYINEIYELNIIYVCDIRIYYILCLISSNPEKLREKILSS